MGAWWSFFFPDRDTSGTSKETAKPSFSNPVSGARRADAIRLMSEKDKRLLNSRLPQLISKISIEGGLLLAHLRRRRALTQQQEEAIKSKGDRSNQIRCLVDVLLKGDSNTVDKFIYSLRATDQSNVAELLRQPKQPDDWEQLDTGSVGLGATNFLSVADAKLLERYRPELMGDVNLSDGSLLAELRSRGVLTNDDEGYIKGITRNGNAVAHIVDLVLRKSPNLLEEFLHALNHTGHSFVVDYLRPPAIPDETRYVRGGRFTEELQDSLKENMREKLEEWNTRLEEGLSNRKEGESTMGKSKHPLLPYINQPCPKTKISRHQSLLNAVELVENSHPGDRLVIYGEAGMGKTTLLKQLARSWIEESNSRLVDKFAFVFLIPLRLVGKISLLSIICEELKLVPKSSQDSLKEALDRQERKVIFLLDSYEELREDIISAKNTELDDLITGRLFPKSTVILTLRPGFKLEKSKNQTTAQLGDLPKNEVKRVIEEHFGGDADAVQRSFPAMAYLQKPINLALFIFIITQNKQLALSCTQAELFSLILQYIMLAFAKKKKLKEFIPQASSYIANKAIPADIRRLFRDIAKKCYEGRKENIIHIKEDDDMKEYLDFGLFTAGKYVNTVVLPHRLFTEYFTAAHLAENCVARNALFEEIKGKLEKKPSRPLLTAVLRAMGLENVLRFLLTLTQQPELEQVCQQVGSLFVLERKKIDECDNYRLVNFRDSYYTELIRECSDESAKGVLVTALLNATIREVTDRENEDKSHVFLPYLDYTKRVTFLNKCHNLDLYVDKDKLTLSCNRLGITERNIQFVAALVYWYDCSIKAGELDIRGESDRRLNLPASLLTRMTGVRQLRLTYCTLREELSEYMREIDMPATLQHSSASRQTNTRPNCSLERVELFHVIGLEHCDTITPCQCQLVIEGCGNVRANALNTWFPRVSELELADTTRVMTETEEELTSWLSTVQTVRRLRLASRKYESLSLCHLLNILAEREGLEYLELNSYTLLLDVRDIGDTIKQNNTLSTLKLNSNYSGLLGQLLEVCSRQCPQLKAIEVFHGNLVSDFDERVESAKRQLPGLQKLKFSAVVVDKPRPTQLAYPYRRDYLDLKRKVKQFLQRLCPSAEIDIKIIDIENVLRL